MSFLRRSFATAVAGRVPRTRGRKASPTKASIRRMAPVPLEEKPTLGQLLEADDTNESATAAPHTMPDRRLPIQETLTMGRHTKITAGGRIFSFSALVVVGDGNGTAGFGYGKALSGGAAVQKATRDAEKLMFAVPLTEDGRMLTAFKCKHDGAQVSVRPLRPGSGVRASPLMTRICEAFGVTDLSIKAHGRRNIKNVVRAFFKGMSTYPRSERELAEARGLKYFDPRRDYRYKPAKPSNTSANVWVPQSSDNRT